MIGNRYGNISNYIKFNSVGIMGWRCIGMAGKKKKNSVHGYSLKYLAYDYISASMLFFSSILCFFLWVSV
jgi:hypothetical protein